MYSLTVLLITLMFRMPSLEAQSIFFPENGSYNYDLPMITDLMKKSHEDYVSLNGTYVRRAQLFKWDKKRNEFQVKDWFLQDWFIMQDLFRFDQTDFIASQGAQTFIEAKRRQYSKYSFDKDDFFHYKTVPTMKEWGGLTHPPVKKLTLPLKLYHPGFYDRDYSVTKSGYFNPEFQKELDTVSRSELSFGNELMPLADHAVYLKKLEMIQNAKDSILMSSLVFACDPSTKKLVDLLIKKYHEGVDVKIMTDGTISKLMGYRQCLKLMESEGIAVVETKDFFKYKMKSIYHTKTLIVDMKEAIAGGHNMIDADNLSRGTDFKNRDVDLYVKGPMVTDIAKQFVENWAHQRTLAPEITELKFYEYLVRKNLAQERREGLRGPNMYASILGNTSTRMNGVCRFVKQAPYEDGNTITKAYLKLLERLTFHLVVTNAIDSDSYTPFPMFQASVIERMDSFKMFNQLHLKVQDLAKRGKKIDYITTNMRMAGNENVAIMDETIKDQLNVGKKMGANWSLFKLELTNNFYGNPHYKNLLKDWYPYKNVHVWNNISFLHSKIFYFDRLVASVGSLNFQHNATDHAYESTSICMDETLNHELDKILVQDMVNSIPLIFSKLR